MRWLAALALTFTLSGCLSNISFSDLATTGGATIGAGVSTAAGLAPLPVIASTVVGAGTGAILVAEPESTVDILEALLEEERVEALKNQQMWEAIESLGWYAVLGIVAFFLIPWLIGYLMPNGKQRKMHKMMFDNPKINMKDLK